MLEAKQKRTMIFAGIIGTLFSCYDENEKTRLHHELHGRIGKGFRTKVRKHGKAYVTKVGHDDAGAVWKEAVDHFAARKITIEASACVLSLWNLDEKMLEKHFGMNAIKIGKWARPSRREDRVELEKASREVARYVFNAANKLYGIEEEKKMGVLERLKMMKETA